MLCSRLKTNPLSASHSLAADTTKVSSTAWRLNVGWLITLRTSPAARSDSSTCFSSVISRLDYEQAAISKLLEIEFDLPTTCRAPAGSATWRARQRKPFANRLLDIRHRTEVAALG